jgi:NADH dehydrogenase
MTGRAEPADAARGTRRVVFVGGGYVTLQACAQLRGALPGPIRRGAIKLTVISADTAHRFHGFTGEVLAGILPVRRTRTSLVAACRSATVLHGTVLSVDPDRRAVTYRPAAGGAPLQLPYDELVVGTGGREPTVDIPGLADHGYTLRGPGDTEKIADAIGGLTTAGGRVLVAGGGLAGVELAAAIADRGRGRIAVTLVHSGPRLLPDLSDRQPRLVRRAEKELTRLGITVHTGVAVRAVTRTGVTLSDGRFLAADLVVGTVGQRPVRLTGLPESWHDDSGRLITAPDLSVADGVWAAGDVARVLHPMTGEPVVANALWAIKAGAHVGRNLARSLQDCPTAPFGYRGLGQAASFGLGRSIGEIYGVPITGVFAWWMRLAFFLRFHPSRRQAVGVLGDLLRAASGARVDPDGRWSQPASGSAISRSASESDSTSDSGSDAGWAPVPGRRVRGGFGVAGQRFAAQRLSGSPARAISGPATAISST